jgi:hypothetical protein
MILYCTHLSYAKSCCPVKLLSKMLCDVCQSILVWVFTSSQPLEELSKKIEHDHQTTYAELEQSAQQSCYICSRLLFRLNEYSPDIKRRASILETPLLTTACVREEYGFSLRFTLSANICSMESLKDITEGFDFVGIFELLPTSNEWPEDAAVSNTTNIATCGELVLRWLKTCLDSHPVCSRMRKGNWYPTRLLDLGGAGSNHDDFVKLIETGEQRLNGPYVTLSHCWGGANIIKLTTGTFDQFSKGIPITDLPRTFYDAIMIAKFLKIRYIWIDSMTIFQDSTDDWAKEVSLVGEVYRNSFCNIAATASENSFGGLFLHRNVDLVNPCQVYFGQQKYQLIRTDTWTYGIDEAPLNRRGWVFQERWLCPRMLHFSSEQLFWECRTVIASEFPPSNPPSRLYDHFKYDDGSIAWGGGKSGDIIPTDKRSRIAEHWSEIVYGYSGTNLTFDSDKLIALSGVAKVVQQELNDDYLAGLWKEGIIFQLAWLGLSDKKQIGNKPVSSRPKTYTAPSWSWAALNGEIWYPVWPSMQEKDRHRELSSLLSYHLNFKSPDRTGQIESGYIDVCGPITEVSVSMTTSQAFPFYNYRIDANGVLRDYHINMDVEPGGDGWDESFIYLALYFDSLGGRPEHSYQVVGLLLRQVPGATKQFSRVGYLMIRDQSQITWCMTPKAIASLPDTDFDLKQGYKIRII